MTNLFGRNIAKKISISLVDQSADTNRTRIEHILFTAVTICLKYIVIGSERLGKKLIAEANQEYTSIYIEGNSYWEFPCRSWKSGNKKSVDFRRNVDEKIAMNPSRSTGSPRPQVTRTRMRNCNIFDLVSRVSTWNGTMKNDTGNLVKNLRDNKIFKNSEHKDNFNVEKLGHKNSINWNHTDLILNWNKKIL